AVKTLRSAANAACAVAASNAAPKGKQSARIFMLLPHARILRLWAKGHARGALSVRVRLGSRLPAWAGRAGESRQGPLRCKRVRPAEEEVAEWGALAM